MLPEGLWTPGTFALPEPVARNLNPLFRPRVAVDDSTGVYR